MKKIIIFFLPIFLLVNLYADKLVDRYYYKLKHMNRYQYEVYQMIWYNASKVNLAYTLTAIALVESDMGVNKLNLADPSCGIFHKLATEYAKDLGLRPTLWNASRVCEKLYKSNELSYKVAEHDMQTLIAYWIKKGKPYNIAWKYAIMSYNAGPTFYTNKYKYLKAKIYYKKIVAAIRAISKFRKRRIK